MHRPSGVIGEYVNSYILLGRLSSRLQSPGLLLSLHVTWCLIWCYRIEKVYGCTWHQTAFAETVSLPVQDSNKFCGNWNIRGEFVWNLLYTLISDAVLQMIKSATAGVKGGLTTAGLWKPCLTEPHRPCGSLPGTGENLYVTTDWQHVFIDAELIMLLTLKYMMLPMIILKKLTVWCHITYCYRY